MARVQEFRVESRSFIEWVTAQNAAKAAEIHGHYPCEAWNSSTKSTVVFVGKGQKVAKYYY